MPADGTRRRLTVLAWDIVLRPARLPSSTWLRFAAAFCLVVGVYDVLTITLFLSGGPLIGPPRWAVFPDFLVFHAASRAFWEGHLATVYDFDAFGRFWNATYVDRLGEYVDFRPFLYPPQWVLLTLPLGLVGVGMAYGLFMSATAAVATYFAGRRDMWGWIAVLTSPAALWTMVSGQNAFLSVGLFYGGFQLADRSPAIAGLLLGLLSYKPQLWVLVPVALFAGRQWRVLGWTLASAAALAFASLALFGGDVWAAFSAMAREAASPKMVDKMFLVTSSYMTTFLAAGRIIGFGPAVAIAVHLMGALAGISTVWFAMRRYPSSNLRTTIVAIATLLITPYLINYDMMLIMPAAVLVFRCRAAKGFLPAEPLLYAVLWLIPNHLIRLNQHHLPVTPVLVMALLVLSWRTLRTQPR